MYHRWATCAQGRKEFRTTIQLPIGNIMTAIIKSLTFVLVLTGFAGGCYKGIEVDPTVSFDLPPGWELLEKRPGYTAAWAKTSTKDGVGPYVKLETTSVVSEGDEQTAKLHVLAYHDNGAAVPGWPANEFHSIVMPNGTTVYASIVSDDFWPGQLSWVSSIAYSKDGYLITMYLSDRADLYVEELDTITKSTIVHTEIQE